VVHPTDNGKRFPATFSDEQNRISMELIYKLRKVEQKFSEADDFYVFYEVSKHMLEQALLDWEQDTRIEKEFRGFDRASSKADAHIEKARFEEQLERQRSNVSHGMAREHIDSMICAFGQTSHSSDEPPSPVAVFRQMGIHLQRILTISDQGTQAVVDEFMGAIESGTASLENVRDMVMAGKVGMSIELAPVIAQLLATGAPDRPPRFLHDAVELVRRDLERQDAAIRLMSLVRQPLHSPVRARYIMEDENFQMQLEISGSLLSMTEQTLQEIAELEQKMKESRATNNYALSVASFFRACQVALTDMTYMSSSRILFGNRHVSAQRLRALRSDPQLYKAWVDDMCQVSEPLPCNDTP
jgi:hypothetical protein